MAKRPEGTVLALVSELHSPEPGMGMCEPPVGQQASFPMLTVRVLLPHKADAMNSLLSPRGCKGVDLLTTALKM